jgi:TolB protein
LTPAWSPDATAIAFARIAPGEPSYLAAQIFLMDADGSHVRRFDTTVANAWEPAWSPDGSKIAFVGFPAGGADCSCLVGGDIYVSNADGTGLRRLTRTRRADDEHPTWSPDGKTIAFSSVGATGTAAFGRLELVPARGGRVRSLVRYRVGNDPDTGSPTWGSIP